MEQPTWAGVRAIILAVTALYLLPLQAQVERNWEFSLGAFGGKVSHSNEDITFNVGEGSGFTTGAVHGVVVNDAPTFGARSRAGICRDDTTGSHKSALS